MAHVPVSFRLDKEKDKDIVNYLDGKPKTYIIKEAIRRYMKEEERRKLPEEIETKKESSSDFEPFT